MLLLNRDKDKKPKELTPEEEIANLKKENSEIKSTNEELSNRVAKAQEAIDFLTMNSL